MKDKWIKREIVKIEGKHRELVTIKDKTGKVIHKILTPLKLEFHPKDILQIIIGATILAIPVAFTEETWKLAESLPIINIFGFLSLSLIFIGAFVYYNYYRGMLKNNEKEFIHRVLGTYVFSLIVVTAILLLIQKAPWHLDWVLALKRTILIAFPASMSAAIADVIK